MKKLVLFIGLMTILLMSCQARTATQTTATFASTNTPVSLTDTPQVFSNDYHVGNPVENDSQAQIAALKSLKANFTYNEPLIVVNVEKMSYGESKELMEQPLNQTADLEIWMILYFNSEWKSNLPDLNGTPLPILPGCVYVAIKAVNGSPVEVGGPLNQVSAFPECAH